MNKYIMMFVAAIALVSCSDDVLETPSTPVKAGAEVQFGLSLEGTRTIYGEEANDAFPIYWTNEDKVQIYSPECLKDRNNAEYKVSVATANQAYADKLTKIDSSGVQWGENASADFYSIYPSKYATLKGASNAVTADVTIATEQSATNIRYAAADMTNVIMYAHTDGIAAGNPVNLQYNPLSTVIEFELNVNASDNKSITVNSLTLTAPTGINIAGDFALAFPATAGATPTLTSTSNGSNSITMHIVPSAKLDATNTTLKAKMSLLPINQTITGDWKVTVNYNDGLGAENIKNATAPLSPKANANSTLVAGKIHKIVLPAINATKEWIYTPANWMPQLPDYERIYLSELSLPGAWYAGATTDSKYQATDNFTTYWNAGLRAFAVECRAYTPRTGIIGTGNIGSNAPTRICISGQNTSGQNGATTNTWGRDVKYISEVISSIAGLVSEDDEFAVLILNYADGGDHGHRPDYDYKNFIKLVQTEITNAGASNVLYGITPNTTIADAIGKVVIIVAVDERVNYATNGVNAMFAATPLPTQIVADGNSVADVYFSDFINTSNWATTNYAYSDVVPTSTSGLKWCFTSANRTAAAAGSHGLPTYDDRKTALNTMMDYSDEIYENSDHNVWFYFNAGGTEATSTTDTNASPTKYATEMNKWLKTAINNKVYGTFDEEGNLIKEPSRSPLGIVMFNQCTSTDYNGPEIIQSIIEMNHLISSQIKRKPATRMSDYDGALKNGGNAIQ